jgi:hypothetical protein
LTLIPVNGGGGPFTVNVTALLLPFAPLTVMLAVPAPAPALIDSVAVICVALTTTTFDTVISALPEAMVDPDTKLNPLIVAPNVAPGEPLLGLMDVMYGVEASTVVEPTRFVPA